MNIREKITAWEPGAVWSEAGDGMFTVPVEKFHALAARLRAEGFDFLRSLTGMDWGEEGFGAVYHLEATATGENVVLRTLTPSREKCGLPSVCDLWKAAELNEREVFDYFGIGFLNHPDMRRLFLRDDWVGHPLRKDYDPGLNPLRMTNEVSKDSAPSFELTADGSFIRHRNVLFEEDEYVINIGPQHPATHGVLRFRVSLEGEIIRKGDMQVEVDGSRKDCFELVTTKDASEVEDHKIVVEGPEIDEIPVGSKISMSYTVEVAGKAMQPDFEPVFERKIHSFLNCVEGLMHTGQRDMIRVRISKADFEAGFKFKHIGEVLYAKIKSEFDTVVDKCQVRIVGGDEPNAALRKHANEVFDKRDERLKSMTDESVPVFYSCIMCQAFSPSHVCIVTPERLGLCGAVSWLDAKATNELDPQGPCQVVTKERCIDERTGRYEDVDEAVAQYSHGALEHVTLYSLLEDPMTSCGCFECISGIEPMSNGFIVVNREYAGMTPAGMTFGELASCTGGGVQTPGYMGHGRHFISSKKFIHAEGGIERIVWMPKELKDDVGERLNKTAKELYGIDNFTDMIADEMICTDCDALLEFLQEKNHPVLSLEPLM